MLLRGSCHCGNVRFEVQSSEPYPFNRCYCSICRKTAGGGGYSINLGGDHDTMVVDGEDHLGIYQATITNPDTGKEEQSPAQRHFCSNCGSALWVWDPRWPKLVHPFASAIDTDLPLPPEYTHMMLGSRANWVDVPADPGDKYFDEYPDESLAAWHERLGLMQEE
ncbi:MAG: GFA family protein [Lysobacterales bacterium]